MNAAARPTSTRAELSAVIKRARNIMRKDPGLNGDADRIPQLSWLLFLKSLDDHEKRREMFEPDSRPLLGEPYRWRDWAGPGAATQRVGAALSTFVDENLLPHLAGMRGTGERDVVGQVFADVRNRMLSGYLLGELIEQIDRVNFNSSDDLHTMAHVYESMLKEMRDSAGDAGEFYTPRPVVRFMVDMIDPQVGETVMDPASGTGGFLVEAHEHVQEMVTSVAQRERTRGTLRGFEKKPQPFLLCQMNLLLHDALDPKVDRANSLDAALSEQEYDGVDVVLTNPPFGGEEEAAIAKSFPAGMRTEETSWLFLQAVMARILRRKGRAAVVVPNSTLFGKGVGGRIKKKLLENFDLHTVVRLPNGVFEPYTAIPSNLLFFEAGRPTAETWFYELPTPEGRKKYTKTKPLRHEEFADLQAWWGEPGPGPEKRKARVENEHSWKVGIDELVKREYDLDLRNPHVADALEDRPVAEILDELVDVEEQILDLLRGLRAEVVEEKK
ncbi:class I SAM-dependent DNA methyltransferase [Isoptericola sp. NPDC019482]|uniref:class I SAM-dependent DNA methyltransferase n=1 Tax=Isoptericola sp. NPDC019482 TaxID=3154688 RepID=UPI0034915410